MKWKGKVINVKLSPYQVSLDLEIYGMKVVEDGWIVSIQIIQQVLSVCKYLCGLGFLYENVPKWGLNPVWDSTEINLKIKKKMLIYKQHTLIIETNFKM